MSNEFAHMIRIGNLRKGALWKPEKDDVVIYCDRRNTILGNPFILNNKDDDAMREVVIDKFNQKFKDDWAKRGRMYKEVVRIAKMLLEGKRIILMCWCAGPPTNKKCHVEMIRKKIIDVAIFLQKKI